MHYEPLEPSTTTITVLDALVEKGGGAVQNGRFARISHHPRRAAPERNGEVILSRPPVEGWDCDTCFIRGRGPRTMFRHTEDTGHRTFTAI